MGYQEEVNTHYLVLLRKNALYDTTTVELFDPSPFKYQDQSNEKLKSLRHLYNLDEVAGDGSETEQILNLMSWVHKTIRHDGNFGFNPSERNALYILGSEQT
jgi:hypothetical protein